MVGVREFMVRWGKGVKSYSGSVEGSAFSKLCFLFPVVVGLFGVGSLYLLSGGLRNYLFAGIFIGYGCFVMVDIRLLFKQYRLAVKQRKFLKGGGV